MPQQIQTLDLLRGDRISCWTELKPYGYQQSCSLTHTNCNFTQVSFMLPLDTGSPGHLLSLSRTPRMSQADAVCQSRSMCPRGWVQVYSPPPLCHSTSNSHFFVPLCDFSLFTVVTSNPLPQYQTAPPWVPNRRGWQTFYSRSFTVQETTYILNLQSKIRATGGKKTENLNQERACWWGFRGNSSTSCCLDVPQAQRHAMTVLCSSPNPVSLSSAPNLSVPPGPELLPQAGFIVFTPDLSWKGRHLSASFLVPAFCTQWVSIKAQLLWIHFLAWYLEGKKSRIKNLRLYYLQQSLKKLNKIDPQKTESCSEWWECGGSLYILVVFSSFQ